MTDKPLKRGDRPAFPMSHSPWDQKGMTLREYFAGQTLAGLLANPDLNTVDGFVRDAVRYADALLAALEAKPCSGA